MLCMTWLHVCPLCNGHSDYSYKAMMCYDEAMHTPWRIGLGRDLASRAYHAHVLYKPLDYSTAAPYSQSIVSTFISITAQF